MGVTVTPDGVRTVEVVRDNPVISVPKQETAVAVASGGLQGPPGNQGEEGPPGPDGSGDNETFDTNLALLYGIAKL